MTSLMSVVGMSLFWQIHKLNDSMTRLATQHARATFDKDLLYRRWASLHGGVYAPITRDTQPNPYLKNLKERDITTPSGVQLTKINPAYMTRQVFQLAHNSHIYSARITSLTPINPINEPTQWERAALCAFENGNAEYVSTNDNTLHFMRPLITEESCLSCHRAQGYKVGDIRGGISVAVSLKPFHAVVKDQLPFLIGVHLGIAFFLLAGGFVVYRRFYAKTAQLESSRQFSRELLENTSATIIGLDEKGLVRLLNPQAERNLGLTAAAANGKDWFKNFVAESHMIATRTEFERLCAGELPQPIESPIVTDKGNENWFSWSFSSVKPNREGISVLAFGTDITEKKRLAEQLGQSERMRSLGQLAGGIAHDFNNILAAIFGFTDVALMSVPKDSNIKHYLEQILTASERARRLVSQILMFSRKSACVRNVIHLHLLIKEAVELLKATLPSSVTIHTHCETAVPPIWGNTTQLHEVIMNLAANAVDAMAEKGTLSISVRPSHIEKARIGPHGTLDPGVYAAIEITDTGPGMEPAMLEQIFEPFFTTKQVGKGTGLGLSVVLGVVQSHNGRIFVESEIDRGTTFTIYFPKTEAPTATVDHSVDPSLRGSEKILFVDDEPLIREATCATLAAYGYQVTAAEDAEHALTQLKDPGHSFDLLITDQTMPHMTGEELVGAALKLHPELPVILCTGHSNIVSEANAQQLGIARFCQKPLSTEELGKTIREVLDNGND